MGVVTAAGSALQPGAASMLGGAPGPIYGRGPKATAGRRKFINFS